MKATPCGKVWRGSQGACQIVKKRLSPRLKRHWIDASGSNHFETDFIEAIGERWDFGIGLNRGSDCVELLIMGYGQSAFGRQRLRHGMTFADVYRALALFCVAQTR
ncbi:hypothetical protein DXM25_20135 [Agrobacterium rosae]|nr:hypothetical protein DXM25_20135 [Agrobacterium rosae]MQB50421.1 hypothetical protein [Agrobacterium rosae]